MAKKFSLLERIPWEQAYTSFLALEREKKWLAIAGIGFFLMLMVFLPVSCASKRLGRLETEYLNSQKNLTLLSEQAKEYQALKKEVDALESSLAKNKDMSLSTVLEGLAKPIGITHIDFKAYTSSSPQKDEYDVQSRKVEIKETALASITEYLEKIQTSKQALMVVDKLDIKTNRKNRALLDATFVVTTFIPKAEAVDKEKS